MIIIIDNYDSFTYNLYQSVADKADTRVFRNDKISVEDIDALNPDGIILSPGPGRPENAGICVELVKKLGAHYPILGICLGHQAIAQAYGGKIKRQQKIVHGKSSLVHHLNDELFDGMPVNFMAARYHSLGLELNTLPADLVVTAISSQNTIMAIKHVSHQNYGLQFHPESILTPQGQTIIDNFISICQENNEDFYQTACAA